MCIRKLHIKPYDLKLPMSFLLTLLKMRVDNIKATHDSVINPYKG